MAWNLCTESASAEGEVLPVGTTWAPLVWLRGCGCGGDAGNGSRLTAHPSLAAAAPPERVVRSVGAFCRAQAYSALRYRSGVGGSGGGAAGEVRAVGADLVWWCGVLAEPLTTTQIAIAQISLWFPVVMIVVVRNPKPRTRNRLHQLLNLSAP